MQVLDPAHRELALKTCFGTVAPVPLLTFTPLIRVFRHRCGNAVAVGCLTALGDAFSDPNHYGVAPTEPLATLANQVLYDSSLFADDRRPQPIPMSAEPPTTRSMPTITPTASRLASGLRKNINTASSQSTIPETIGQPHDGWPERRKSNAIIKELMPSKKSQAATTNTRAIAPAKG